MIVKETGGDFEEVEPGTYAARCYRLIDLGTSEGEYQGKPTKRHQILVGYELSEKMKNGEPFVTSSFYTLSLNEKAILRKHLESWRGKVFTKEELGGFDLKTILGSPCMLSMAANEKGKVRVASVSKLMKGMEAPKLVNPKVYLSLDPEEFDGKVMESLGKKLQEMIKASPEYAALTATTAAIDEPPDDGIPDGDFGSAED